VPQEAFVAASFGGRRRRQGQEIAQMRWAAGALLVLLSLVGCTHTVTGSARQAARAVEILPTEDEVTATVGNTLSTFGFRPFIGNVEILPDGYRTEADATPIACIAVTDTAPRMVYEPAPVLEAARQSYFNWDVGVDISGAGRRGGAVVRRPTRRGATFESFVRRWQAVRRRLPSSSDPGGQTKSGDRRPTSVRSVKRTWLLSATARTRGRYECLGRDVRACDRRAGGHHRRSVAGHHASGRAAATAPTPAVRLVHVMLDKVGW